MVNGSVYLAGGMAGHKYDDINDWRIEARKTLAEVEITTYSPLRAKEFLSGFVIDENKEQLAYPMATPPGITTRDRFDVRKCDVILMNVLESEYIISIGSCIELGWADLLGKPVVLICKKDGKYDKHPMIHSMVGYKVHTKKDGINLVMDILLPDGYDYE